MALFEGYERKIDKINGVLAQYGISSVEECKTICEEKGFDPYTITKNIQPICFEDAAWAYTVGAAIAIKKGVKTAAEAAEAIGIGLQPSASLAPWLKTGRWALKIFPFCCKIFQCNFLHEHSLCKFCALQVRSINVEIYLARERWID